MDLAPLRAVITADTREAKFVISNPARRIIDGRASWVDLTATEQGYAPASADERQTLSAAPLLSLSPAYFRLKPGERTEITVTLKDGARLPKGELRSHLLIEANALRTPIRKAGGEGLQVDLSVGVSAPVMVRGAGSAAAQFANTELVRDDEGFLVLSTAIQALGDHSAYGRIVASFTPAPTAFGQQALSERILGQRANVAAFPDTEYRRVDVPLGAISLGAGKLTLRFEGAAEFHGRIFAERSFAIEPPPG
ncbi:MAG: hypothetical protein AAGC77_01110 [Pseudomonadota bacterium]